MYKREKKPWTEGCRSKVSIRRCVLLVFARERLQLLSDE